MKQKGYFLFALFLLFFHAEVSAQFEPAPVTRSAVIETINGKAYYIHTVMQGQTLFSIARAYEVTPQAIASENPEFPDLIEVVRTGQVIRIPGAANVQRAQRPAAQATATRPVPPSGQPTAAQPGPIIRAPITVTEFVAHEVARRETLYGIARKYGITQEEILHFNPEARSGLRFRQVLQIPQKTSKPVDYFYYTVEPGETKFGLSSRFGITQEEMITMNPEVEELGLKAGQRIRIPGRVAQATGAVPPQPEGYVLFPVEPVPEEKIRVADAYCLDPELKVNYNVALLIPLFLNQFDETSSYTPVDHISFTFIQYYQGILIALDSIRQKGVNITLHPYDVGRDLTTVRDLTRQPSFSSIDLIIGPFYPETLSFVAGFGLRNGIPVVSPLLDDPSQLKNFPNLFQVNPSMQTQLSSLAGYLARTYPDQNIILVHNNQPQAQSLIQGFKVSLREELDYIRRFGDSLDLARVDGYFFNGALVGGRRTNVLVASDSLMVVQNQTKLLRADMPSPEIKEIIYSTVGFRGLTNAFEKDRKNLVITLIGGEAFLSNYLRQLNQLTSQYDLTLFGTPQWNDYQTIDPRYFETLNVHIFSPDFIEYRDQHIRDFVYRYREVFRSEPSVDAFRGVQAGYFFFSALGRYGKQFPRCMDQLNGPGYQNPFLFEKLETKDDGWENLKFILYHYRDYRRENVLRPFPAN